MQQFLKTYLKIYSRDALLVEDFSHTELEENYSLAMHPPDVKFNAGQISKATIKHQS